MLKPQQFPELKKLDRNLYGLARVLLDAINRFALQLGIDPKPANQIDPADAIPAPNAPKSITVTSVAGVVLAELEAGADNLPTTFYFVERSDTETFQQIQARYTLGHALTLAVPVPPGISFWRAFCKYQMSLQSPYVVASSLSPGGGGPGGGGGEGTSGGGVSTQGIPEVFYSQSQTKTVTVTPETTLFAPIVPSLPADFFNQVDKTLRIKACGYFSNPTLGPSLTVRIKVGSAQISTTARLLREASNHFWESEALFTCRATGVSGQLIAQGSHHYEHA